MPFTVSRSLVVTKRAEKTECARSVVVVAVGRSVAALCQIVTAPLAAATFLYQLKILKESNKKNLN